MSRSSVPVLRRLPAALVVVLVLATGVPTVAAEPDHAGRWVSDSRRDSGFGYVLTLKRSAVQAADYAGSLRFFYPDGRVGSTVRVVANGMGETVVLTARSGSFDRSGRTLRATIDPRSGEMTFVNCQERLRLVMSWALDSDCVLRRTR